MRRRVVITGAGLVTALGATPAEFGEALRAGRSALAPPRTGPEVVPGCALAGQIPTFSPEGHLGERNLRPLDRASQLLAAAARGALEGAGWTPGLLAECEVGLVVGTLFSGVRTIAEFDRRALREGPCYASPMDFANTVINAAGGQAAIWHNLRGINSTLAGGASSGLQAVAYAADLVRGGRARAVLAGGFDEVSFESLHGFARAGLLAGGDGSAAACPVPFDVRRNGLVVGEGAALLVLEDAGSAADRGARPLAEVQGCGLAFERPRGPSQPGADAVARAMRLALDDAGITPEEVDCVSASANGSVAADRAEAAALEAAFLRPGPRPAVTAIKSLLGDCLGAAGALQMIELLEAMRTGLLPGIRGLERPERAFLREKAAPHSRAVPVGTGLVNGTGPDGNCCSVVLRCCQAA